jgi:cell pole-organizing protein PopZ
VKIRPLIATVVAAASAAAPVAISAPADAARCVSGEEIRQQVATFVHSLRDDVRSADARAAVRGTAVASVQAARGAKAQSPAERRALGEQISALAKQLQDAPGLVERKALIAQIHALQEQKRQDRVSAKDIRGLEADLRAVKRAVTAKVDTPKEGRQVAAFVHGLIEQFDC